MHVTQNLYYSVENLLKRLAVILVKLDQTYDQFPAFAPVFTRIEVLLLAKAIEFWAVVLLC